MGRRRGEHGVALVEFGIVAGLLFALVFGIIDFGWAFSQNIDLKNAAREGARLAVVNGGTGGDPAARAASLLAEVRARSSDLADADTQVAITLHDGTGDGVADDIGDKVVVCVRYPLRSVSGFYSSMLDGDFLRTKVVMRMEKVPNFSADQTANWNGGTCAP